MKKLLSILALAGIMAACNTGADDNDATDSTKEAIDSAADVKIEAIDSTRDARIDSTENHSDSAHK